ncbi:MAG TPA: SPW repeat protein [Casimicrobiaceae bacterium]
MFKSLKWEDWLGIGLGVWLLASPWALGFSDQQAATMNALIIGSILVLEEFLEVGVHETVEEWIDLVVGLWLMVSPLVLGFTSYVGASVNTVLVGLLTVVFAAWAMSPLDEQLGRWWHDHVTGH